MKRLIILTALMAVMSVGAFAHTAFTLVSSEKLTVTGAQLDQLQKQATVGTVSGQNLTFTGSDIKLVFTAGPEEDMLSYRVQGVRNPNIVTPGDVRITVWFVNTDGDMNHDLLFAHYMADFTPTPDLTGTAGTKRVGPHSDETGPINAEKVVITSNEDGAYKYFCSVRGHAKGGMWGNIFVGVKPGRDMVMPAKPNGQMNDMPGMDMSPKPTPKPTVMPSMPGMDMEPKPKPTPAPAGEMSNMPGMTDNKSGGMSNMSGVSNMSGMNMTSNVDIGSPMTREGSGTAWLPDSSPRYAWMKMFGDGSILMVHGVMFFRYTSIGSNRDVSAAGKGGRQRFDAPSMFMVMYTKPLGKRSQVGLRTMFSPDPAIERGYGYPLLYQTGESFRGEPLHDRQHPHDFISELAATYSYKVSEKGSVFFYAGYPGEPSLGPVMYLHRPSGVNNPDAPIGHHWEDSAHISFGVLTAGYTYDKVKFEVSAFNGTEPDENRWAFDSPKINSFSARLSFNPTKSWSFQISHGYLRSPERLEPETWILRRTTASAMYNKSFSDDRNWSNTMLWGQNHSSERTSNSFLYESNCEFSTNSIFGRAEWVQKNAQELALPSPAPGGNFLVHAYSLGYLRDIVKDKGIDVGIGGMATANFNPSSIAKFYGGTTHGGWQLFVRLRPSKQKH